MEERNVKIDLETARKWYKGSDESLKNIALQAFKEEELNSYLKWEDLLQKSPKELRTWVDSFCNLLDSEGYLMSPDCFKNKNYNTKKALALIKYSMLIEYYGGSITTEEWESTASKIIPITCGNKATHCNTFGSYSPIAFHTEEQFDEFYKNNPDIIKDYLGL